MADWVGRRVHLKTSARDLSAEALALRACGAVGTRGVSAVSLVAYEPTKNVLVTEHVEGVSMFNLVWNNTSWPHALRRWPVHLSPMIVAVADWAAEFHAGGILTNAAREDCLKWLEQSFHAKLAGVLRKSPDNLSQRQAEMIRVRFGQALVAKSWAELPVCSIHADFSIVNIVGTKAHDLVVLDFADTRAGFALEDVVRFWSSIWEVSMCGAIRRRVLSQTLPRILGAAALPHEVEHSEPFVALRIWNALTKIHEAAASHRLWSMSTRLIVGRLAAVQRRWLLETCEP